MDNQRVECPLPGARAIKDGLIASALLRAVFFMSSYFNALENFAKLSHHYERLQFDELIIVLAAVSLAMSIFSARRLQELKQNILLGDRAEEMLRCHEARFRLLISSSLDMDGVLAQIARAAATLMAAPLVTFWTVDEEAHT
jgi:hypothetical protein